MLPYVHPVNVPEAEIGNDNAETGQRQGTAMMELSEKPILLEQTIITIKIEEATVAATDFRRSPIASGRRDIPAAPTACIRTFSPCRRSSPLVIGPDK